MSNLKNFIVHNPNANRWLTIILALIVFIIVIKIIKSITSAVMACLMFSILFNFSWGNIINGVISSGEISKYITKDNAIKVQEMYKDLTLKNRRLILFPNKTGQEALRYIQP